jgi:indole-3-glycerol phosphate synthase
MDILEKIIAHKHKEVALARQKPLQGTEEYFRRSPIALKDAFLERKKGGLIAEYKRKSPSKGIINEKNSVEEVTNGYVEAGATALSVLTDEYFFGGKIEDLVAARVANPTTPILRKDFIIHRFQIEEAKRIGADVILLIAECLDKREVKELATVAKDLGLSILFEIHSEDQLDKFNYHIDAIGVNNRNLKTFTVSIEHSIAILPKMPTEVLKISESGIHSPEVGRQLLTAGFDGLLVGEQFMKTDNPMIACETFLQKL